MRKSAATAVRGRKLETVALAAGLLLIAVYFGARAYGEIERREAVSTFMQIGAAPEPAHAGGTSTDAVAVSRPRTHHGSDQSLWSAGRIRAHAALVAQPSALPEAVLRLARVQLEVPVYADTTERNLNRGAGLIAGTAAADSDGNIAIAAHRDGYFRVLEQVVVGDILELATRSGMRRFEVTELSIVEPTDVSPLDATDVPAITLVTCYPFYFVGSAPLRYIVRAVAMQSAA